MRKTSIPLTLINLNDDGFHLLVEIVVYKEKHLVVLDTGASRSVFDIAFTDRFALKPLSDDDLAADENFATTLFSTSNTVLANFPHLKIGRITVSDYAAVALDLSSVNEAYEQLGHPKVAGILGGDILFKYAARIDYKRLKLTLSYQ